MNDIVTASYDFTFWKLLPRKLGMIELYNFDSSNISEVVYSPSTKELFVLFNSRSAYKYSGVSISTIVRWCLAPSAGKFFWSKVRDQYETTRLSKDGKKISTATSVKPPIENSAFGRLLPKANPSLRMLRKESGNVSEAIFNPKTSELILWVDDHAYKTKFTVSGYGKLVLSNNLDSDVDKIINKKGVTKKLITLKK